MFEEYYAEIREKLVAYINNKVDIPGLDENFEAIAINICLIILFSCIIQNFIL